MLSLLTRDSHTFVKCFGWNLATNSCRCIYQPIYYGCVLCDEVSQRKAVKQTYEASVEGAKKKQTMKLNSDSECQMPNERYIFNPHKVMAFSSALAEQESDVAVFF